MSNLATRKRLSTTTELSTLVLTKGELWVDITKPTVVIGDGITAGGIALAQQNHSHASATNSTPGFLSAADKAKIDALSLAGGYNTIKSMTVPVPAESTVNFSSDFNIVDNPGSAQTEVSMSDAFKESVNSNAIALVLALS